MTQAARKPRKRTARKQTTGRQTPGKQARNRAGLEIDILVESVRWATHGGIRLLLRRAAGAAAAAALPALSTAPAELAIVLTDDSAIRRLNRSWRGVDAATNVLSFPTEAAGGVRLLLGDIVLAEETIAREARAEHKPFAHHVAHLAVHGFLHLLGYDHETQREAEAMEQVEREVLRRLAIPDPYRISPRPGMRRRRR